MVQGFQATGLSAGTAPDPNKILVDRQELFKSIAPEKERPYTDPDVKNVLPQPQGYQRAALTHPCGK